MKYTLVMVIGFSLLAIGCSSGVRFYVCPNELASEMKSKTDIGQKKEVLVGLDYRVLVIHKDKNDKIMPLQHYRPEHTFGNRTHPRIVSFDKPLTLTALIIIDSLKESIGIAVKRLGDIHWRIYWVNNSDRAEIRKSGVVYLPPYDNLPLIRDEKP